MRGPRGSQRVKAPEPYEDGPSQGKWIEELMRIAINSIKSRERFIRNASKNFSIPASSIADWMYGKTKKNRHGFDPFLTKEEECELKAWCFNPRMTLEFLEHLRFVLNCIKSQHFDMLYQFFLNYNRMQLNWTC